MSSDLVDGDGYTPPVEPLGECTEELRVTTDVAERLLREYVHMVEAGCTEPFSTFLINYTTPRKTHILVEVGPGENSREFTEFLMELDVPDAGEIGTITLTNDPE